MALPTQIGAYTVLRSLGSGAMGSVVLAEVPGQAPVAIKLLHELDPDARARFEREAKLMGRIDDPRVVSVLETGVSERGPYLVLEYCPGQDLAQILATRGTLPPRVAARLLAQVARAMSAAHAQGVIHRDLKPANVICDEELRPRVTDFGIATAYGNFEALTESGVLLGTPAYMSPEQLNDPRRVDSRSDIYSLGVILYECLRGQRPYSADSVLLLADKILSGHYEPLSRSVPAELREIVECALEREPDDRFSSADLLAEGLEAFAEGAESQPEPRKLGLALAGASVVSGLLVGLWLLGPDSAQVAASPSAPATSPQQSLSPAPSSSPAGTTSPSSTPEASPTPRASPPLTKGGTYGSELYFARKASLLRVSRRELREAAEAGEPLAMYLLAKQLSLPSASALEREQSLRWIRQAAEADCVEAMSLLSQRLGGSKESLLWRGRAATRNHPGALMTIAARARKNQEEDEAERLSEASHEAAQAHAAQGDPDSIPVLADYSYRRGDLAETRRWLKLGLERDLIQAQVIWARLERIQPRPDVARYVGYYVEAAEAENPEGLAGLARCYAEGLGVERNFERAESLLVRAAASGYTWVDFERVRLLWLRGQFRAWEDLVAAFATRGGRVPPYLWIELGLHLLEASADVPRKADRALLRVKALKLLSRQDPLRSLDSQHPYVLARAIASGEAPGGERPDEVSASLLSRAASLEHVHATYLWAECVLAGRGTEANLPAGLRLLNTAAEFGFVLASERLGDIYLGALGARVPENRAQAIKHYDKAAKGGRTAAMGKLATLCLEVGEFKRARSWSERAWETKGDPAGGIVFALCLIDAQGGAADAERGRGILEKLAEAHPAAGRTLAERLRSGEGLPADPEAAKRYEEQAEKLLRARRD